MKKLYKGETVFKEKSPVSLPEIRPLNEQPDKELESIQRLKDEGAPPEKLLKKMADWKKGDDRVRVLEENPFYIGGRENVRKNKGGLPLSEKPSFGGLEVRTDLQRLDFRKMDIQKLKILQKELEVELTTLTLTREETTALQNTIEKIATLIREGHVPVVKADSQGIKPIPIERMNLGELFDERSRLQKLLQRGGLTRQEAAAIHNKIQEVIKKMKNY